ncbi:nuclease [Desulfopila sp. IMCC35006]|uniref:thermonuclease family protein n=1 Tax=Desulfopila sp. IMCC35006 TaxID=2569542 RepID=UPI0010AC39EB|nr:thermonuclease family protein [Desulfopila sp. IMCC35006]TKB24218.1 nuclease [Desulfopila sp. IMCC35006]
MRKLSFLYLLLSLIISTSAHASTSSFTGQTIDVADGDMITVLNQNNERIKIRLAGIDTPEGSQVYGNQATQFTVSKVSGKRVRIFPETTDRYGRTVAMVLINGENLNEQIVASGNGWVYRKYCTADYCNDWLKLEKAARDARIGLWTDRNSQPPWEWRAEHRNGKSNGSGDNVSVVTAAVAGAGSSTTYHGNRRSHVFHGPSCRDYNCKNCTVRLGSYQDAVGAGYRAHRECVKE